MKQIQIQINIHSAFLKSIRLFISFLSYLNFVSKHYRVSFLELNSNNINPGNINKEKKMIKIYFDRHYDGMGFSEISSHNQHQLAKATNKFNNATTLKGKIKALLEEIYCYFIRNQFNHKDEFCDFNTYVQHWTLANRGCIADEYLDVVENHFGKLEGPLYIIPKKSSWNTRKDWRTNE